MTPLEVIIVVVVLILIVPASILGYIGGWKLAEWIDKKGWMP